MPRIHSIALPIALFFTTAAGQAESPQLPDVAGAKECADMLATETAGHKRLLHADGPNANTWQSIGVCRLSDDNQLLYLYRGYTDELNGRPTRRIAALSEADTAKNELIQEFCEPHRTASMPQVMRNIESRQMPDAQMAAIPVPSQPISGRAFMAQCAAGIKADFTHPNGMRLEYCGIKREEANGPEAQWALIKEYDPVEDRTQIYLLSAPELRWEISKTEPPAMHGCFAGSYVTNMARFYWGIAADMGIDDTPRAVRAQTLKATP